MNTAPKRRLRWYQYSLRSLFLLMLAVAALGSWFAWKKQQVERQRAAVNAIEEMGGSVEYDYQLDSLGTEIPNAEPPGPAWLRALLGDDYFAHVITVNLYETQATDAALKELEGLAKLTSLYLNNIPISGAGLAHLKGLTQLEYLYLDGTQVTDAGLEHLEGLTRLQELSLDNTQVTDAGLKHLEGLTQLRRLFLNSTRVTDAGLAHLKGLTQLEVLWLDGKPVTDDGIKRLQQALPNCQSGTGGYFRQR